MKAKHMQNTLFTSAVSEGEKLRTDAVTNELNYIMVVDECMPSLREIQSDDTVVQTEIISMMEYVR